MNQENEKKARLLGRLLAMSVPKEQLNSVAGGLPKNTDKGGTSCVNNRFVWDDRY